MSERKVLNKYYPPDFDPSKIPRRKMPKDRQQVVRLMAPFSMRCMTCGEFIYKGKKFNARKETVDGETYYGVKIFRFYIKCTQCSAEITFKTDPKNTDYVAEHGIQRNFEPWRDKGPEDGKDDDDDRLAQLEQEQADNDDPMAALESKAIDSKREMDILDALAELKSRSSRIDRAGRSIDGDRVLERVSTDTGDTAERVANVMSNEERLRRQREEEEDEEMVRRVFGRTLGDSAVPSIELGDGDGDGDGDGGGDGGDDDQGGMSPPEASTSSKAASSASPAAVGQDDDGFKRPAVPAKAAKATAEQAKSVSIKRKLDDVEPTALSLLSDSSRDLLAKPVPNPLLKKKKSNALASKLGIKMKK